MQGEVQPCAWRAEKMQGEVCAGSGGKCRERCTRAGSGDKMQGEVQPCPWSAGWGGKMEGELKRCRERCTRAGSGDKMQGEVQLSVPVVCCWVG